ncbi:Fimbrial assembly protein (PilN) [[Clostridium] sordellii]|uniref:PilN domain-containing protein n=1 Tax=Paraclostridium sordellii TaxID=1505 RepID=UPI0005DEBAD1|nr:PilN domain-containing protein [Paeniclostridium sordellii]CEN91861.1 Fimbrial assembly protein (PilN) [[Clostridium] sordellii] [Paeniclostridium sordellii]
MDYIKILNFFDEKDDKRKLTIFQLTSIIIIFTVIIVNFNLWMKVNKQENEINERKDKLNTAQEISYIGNNNLKIKESYRIMDLIKHVNILTLEIDDGKLKIKGQAQDSNQIKYFTNEMKQIKNLKNCNIESINQEGDIYKFDMSSTIGGNDEIQ